MRWQSFMLPPSEVRRTMHRCIQPEANVGRKEMFPLNDLPGTFGPKLDSDQVSASSRSRGCRQGHLESR